MPENCSGWKLVKRRNTLRVNLITQMSRISGQRRFDNSELGRDRSKKRLIRSWRTKKVKTQERKQSASFSNGDIEVLDLLAGDLDHLLANFIKNVRKIDGDEYDPNTLSGSQWSIQRFLFDGKSPFNIRLLKKTMMQGWYYVESLTGQGHDRVKTESKELQPWTAVSTFLGLVSTV